MEVDEAPEERPYQMFDEEAPDVLGPDPGPGSPVTATEDIVLDTPGGILQGSRGWKTNHLIWGRPLRPKDYRTHHRRIDALEEDCVPRSSTDEE